MLQSPVVIFTLLLSLNAEFAWAWTIPAHEKEEALSLKPDLERGRRIYETCAICHSPMGWGTPDGRYPQIAGQHFNVIVKQLTDIRAGNRDAPTMYPFSLYSFTQGSQGIADVSGYIAQLPMVPNNELGMGNDLELGREVYQFYCEECHGKGGEGDNKEFYPNVAGQHYEYLLREIFWIQSGKRRNADSTMVKKVNELNGRDITAVADYIARMRPPAEKVAKTADWWNPDFPRDFMSVPMMRKFPRPPMPFGSMANPLSMEGFQMGGMGSFESSHGMAGMKNSKP
jgi:cytochrome c553